MTKTKIFLVGMPGSGKSTLGKELAQNMGLNFIDLDGEIELNNGKSITKIFEEEGEDAFRDLESKALREQSNRIESFVMSTGGGAPCFNQNMEFMNDVGRTIYLKVDPEELANRLELERNVRPLLNQRDSLKMTIENLLKNRTVIYQQSKIIIESDSISISDLKNELD